MATMEALATDANRPLEIRISSLKTFIDDGNFVLFHNELMKSQRDVLDSTNRPKASAHIMADFITNLWEVDESALPDLNWRNAREDRYRISVAAIITLGIRDGWISLDQAPINRYLRSKAETADDAYIQALAISYLAVGGGDEDVVLFKRLSSSETRSVSRSAVYALGLLCSPAGEKALKQIQSEASGSDERAWAAKTLGKFYGEGRSRRCY